MAPVAPPPVRPAPPSIDPRLRERRDEVRRSKWRRRVRGATTLAATAAVIAGGFGVTRTPLLDVDKVVISGAVGTSEAELLKAADLHRSRQILDVDLQHAKAAAEALPWVRRAEVSRALPGTIRVRVYERAPVAAVRGRELARRSDGSPHWQWVLADGSGRMVATVEELPPLPEVIAPEPPGAPGNQVDADVDGALRVLDALPAPLSGRVLRVEISGGGELGSPLGPDRPGHLVLVLDQAPMVRFGGPTAIEAKLIAVATMLEQADLRGARAIDVRVPTAPVLTHE